MAYPRISVITPTWARHESLLSRCIPSVADQEYNGPIEHIIVSDGPDEFLRSRKFASHIRYMELPEHSQSNGRWGTNARLLGIAESTGDYIAYLDDDDKYRPYHLVKLARLLYRAPHTGFSYSVGCWMKADAPHICEGTFGNGVPNLGLIGTGVIMNRRNVLELATWRDVGQSTIDWDLVERWLHAGVSYTFTPDEDAGVEFIIRPGMGTEGFR